MRRIADHHERDEAEARLQGDKALATALGMLKVYLRQRALLLDRYEHTMQTQKQGLVQSRRRKDKPASDPSDVDRNNRIRRHHGRLVDAGAADPTSTTAAEFGLSTRSIRRILAG